MMGEVLPPAEPTVLKSKLNRTFRFYVPQELVDLVHVDDVEFHIKKTTETPYKWAVGNLNSWDTL